MPVYLTYAIQLLLVIHVFKTGRNRYWIWILIMLPMIGGIAYLVVEVLPELSGSITGQRALRQVRKAVDPGADLRHFEAAWEQSPNADNARRYAAALLERDRLDEAGEVLERALRGFFESEPNLLLLKAQLQFARGEAAETVETLEYLTRENPEFRSAEGHLLQARALEQAARTEDAITEYRSVSGYFPGVEARYRLAAALVSADRVEDARREFELLLNDARLAPAHFRKSQKTWLDLARRDLRALD